VAADSGAAKDNGPEVQAQGQHVWRRSVVALAATLLATALVAIGARARSGAVAGVASGELDLLGLGVEFKKFSSGTCKGQSMYPVTRVDDCVTAAKALGLHNSSEATPTDNLHAPEGCHYFKNDKYSMAMLGISDLNIGHSAGDRMGKHGMETRDVICMSKPYQTQEQEGHCPVCAPAKREKPEIVVPFFERDICKLKYTLRSIEVNDPDHNLGDVYLLWVSLRDSADFKDELLPIVESLRKTRNVTLLDFHAQVLFSRTNGWFAQQIYKLKAASFVKSDYYLVMDTKNTLLQKVKKDTFFTSCNQAKMFAEFPWAQMPEPHKTWFQNSQWKLNVSKIPTGPMPMSVTPILLKKQLVLDMLKLIGEDPAAESMCNGNLCNMLMAPSPGDQRHPTEFTMYLMYAFGKTQLNCSHQVVTLDFAHRWAESLWRGIEGNRQINIQNNIDCTRKIAIGQWAPIMFGSQPRALDHMSHEDRKETEANFVKVYENAGLFDPEKGSPEELVSCLVGEAKDVIQ